MSEFIHLKSDNHSLIIKVDRVPEILHWGAKIAQIDEEQSINVWVETHLGCRIFLGVT